MRGNCAHAASRFKDKIANEKRNAKEKWDGGRGDRSERAAGNARRTLTCLVKIFELQAGCSCDRCKYYAPGENAFDATQRSVSLLLLEATTRDAAPRRNRLERRWNRFVKNLDNELTVGRWHLEAIIAWKFLRWIPVERERIAQLRVYDIAREIYVERMPIVDLLTEILLNLCFHFLCFFFHLILE